MPLKDLSPDELRAVMTLLAEQTTQTLAIAVPPPVKFAILIFDGVDMQCVSPVQAPEMAKVLRESAAWLEARHHRTEMLNPPPEKMPPA